MGFNNNSKRFLLLKKYNKNQLLIINVEDLNSNLYNTLIKICKFIDYDIDKTILSKICDSKKKTTNHANKALLKIKVTKKEKFELYKIYKEENEKLFKFIGRDLGWNNNNI